MGAVLGVVAPVFLIIGAGYALTRAGVFARTAVDGLLTFTVRFAVPLLLFGAIYRLDLARAFDWRLLLSYYAGAVASFVGAIAIARRVFGRRPGEAVAIGFCALFSNAVLIGLPVMTRAYGPEALAPNFVIISIHAPTCYLIGIVTMEITRRDGAGPFETARRAAAAMFSNVLTLALACGFALNLGGVALPGFVMAAVDMAATAALPVALFGIGGALTRYGLTADLREAATVAAFSTLLHPAVAWGLSHLVFALPVESVRAAVVTAAAPVGLNGYVFAAMYARAEGAAASSVLLSTAVSVATVTFWLWMLGGPAPP